MMSLLRNQPFLAPPPSFHQNKDKGKNKSQDLSTAATSGCTISSTNYRDRDRDRDRDQDRVRVRVRVRVRCCRNSNNKNRGGGGGDVEEEMSGCPYKILGLDPTTTTSPSFPSLLKAAFRSRVKEFHPDVCKDVSMDADAIIQRVIHAYEIHLRTQSVRHMISLSMNFSVLAKVVSTHACKEHLMPSRLLPKMVRHVQLPKFCKFTGLGDDYPVQLAVGQCPKRCIHFVTPSQRAILEDLLDSVLTNPYNMGDAALLESLIVKAMFENNRYQKPKREPKSSTEYVDWC